MGGGFNKLGGRSEQFNKPGGRINEGVGVGVVGKMTLHYETDLNVILKYFCFNMITISVFHSIFSLFSHHFLKFNQQIHVEIRHKNTLGMRHDETFYGIQKHPKA